MRHVIFFAGALFALSIASAIVGSFFASYSATKLDDPETFFDIAGTTFLIGMLPAAVCLLIVYGSNRLRWWTPMLMGVIAALLPGMVFGAGYVPTVIPILTAAGAIGGLSFWPFWLWSERLEVSGESR